VAVVCRGRGEYTFTELLLCHHNREIYELIFLAWSLAGYSEEDLAMRTLSITIFLVLLFFILLSLLTFTRRKGTQ
jgi:high-affinity Fe2+/Pb2+ permease